MRTLIRGHLDGHVQLHRAVAHCSLLYRCLTCRAGLAVVQTFRMWQVSGSDYYVTVNCLRLKLECRFPSLAYLNSYFYKYVIYQRQRARRIPDWARNEEDFEELHEQAMIREQVAEVDEKRKRHCCVI
ncbi:hypothetical protein M378DRAFT_518885 [Amanita muscaria Koide BX008]|uniref:Uncharacterized protein n=1 Tax=Amanita muscaria (strain Koide BX008) TaxID=946122 RepID=A0A0C2TFF3_AMAMK|nr:hypothetical protein M378DRAFT_518885 [Amanita muscaria Koide BX008]